MKIANYFLLAVVLSFSFGCSITASKTTDTTSAAPNSADSKAVVQSTPASASAAADETKTAPDAIVKDLYKQHDGKNSPFFQTKNRALVDKYFDKKLADLIWKDANDSKGEVGVIGGDPLYNAQDMDIKNFKIGAAKEDGDRAEVPVSFQNFDLKENLTFMMTRAGGEWKIQDIKYTDGSTLLGWFKDAESSSEISSSTDGNFEGKYQVGDTTCTVRPVKMAFEVRWEKGSGTEMFFSEGRANDQFIFASEVPEGEKSNIFAFEDENYTRGTFYRADGKEFTVRKIK